MVSVTVYRTLHFIFTVYQNVEKFITPELFAQSMCDEFKFPTHLCLLPIAKAIQEQLDEFYDRKGSLSLLKASKETNAVPTTSVLTSAASINTNNTKDDSIIEKRDNTNVDTTSSSILPEGEQQANNQVTVKQQQQQQPEVPPQPQVELRVLIKVIILFWFYIPETTIYIFLIIDTSA
jgi:hypothetical protein